MSLHTFRGLHLWCSYDPQTRRYQQIDPQYCQPGTTVVRLFWWEGAGLYVSVPGASLYTVLANGATRLCEDEQVDDAVPTHHDAHRATV